VTAKAIFERLYLVPGPRQFAPVVTIPYAPTPPPLTLQLLLHFSAFSSIFFPEWSLNFCVSKKSGRIPVPSFDPPFPSRSMRVFIPPWSVRIDESVYPSIEGLIPLSLDIL